jgi:hypothetical protein
MPRTALRKKDWEHRLTILQAWRTWCDETKEPKLDNGATYRAVLDGCAITVRAICGILDVKCYFGNKAISDGPNRLAELLTCCCRGKPEVETLATEAQRCLLEVLYLGNRAVAHPDNGNLDHKVGHTEMTSAINTVLTWLAVRTKLWPELAMVSPDLLKLIP